jgi:hypothetical protein
VVNGSAVVFHVGEAAATSEDARAPPNTPRPQSPVQSATDSRIEMRRLPMKARLLTFVRGGIYCSCYGDGRVNSEGRLYL